MTRGRATTSIAAVVAVVAVVCAWWGSPSATALEGAAEDLTAAAEPSAGLSALGTAHQSPIAQTFVALRSGPVPRIELRMFGYDSAPFTSGTVELLELVGTQTPQTGSILASASIDGADVPTSAAWVEVAFGTPPMVQAGGRYAIRITAGLPLHEAGCCWAFSYAASQYVDGQSWWSYASLPPRWEPEGTGYSDLAFRVYVSTPPRDVTPPTIACSDPAATFLLGADAAVTATVHDTGSGPQSPTLVHVADTSTVGTKTASFIAADLEGNTASTACPYRVIYAFEGFERPVDTGVRNVANADRAIPLRWRVTDARGEPILDLASVEITAVGLACSAGTTPDAVEEYAPGASTLMNLGDGRYQINWKTPSAYAGSCKTLRLDLGDGMSRTADFEFGR